MNKIKQYYDKVILAVLLVIFIISLLFLLLHLGSQVDISAVEKSNLKNLSADYESVRSDTELLRRVDSLTLAPQWLTSSPREGNIDFTDLTMTPEIARCAECLELIYYNDYERKKCSRCGKPLSAEQIVERDLDSDNDGIPDEVERAIGTDPNRFDSDEDASGDTWSNLEKYEMCKESGDYSMILDSRKHPSLTCYLSVEKVESIPLDFMLTSISTNNSDDSTTWRLFVRIGKKGNTFRVNDEFECDGMKFKIIGARRDLPPNAPPGAKPVNRVRVQFIGRSERITVEQNQKIFDPRPRITLSLNMRGTPKPIQTTVGGRFEIGDNATGLETVEVLSVTDNDCTVRTSMYPNRKIVIEKRASRAPFAGKKAAEKVKPSAGVPSAEAPKTQSMDDILK